MHPRLLIIAIITHRVHVGCTLLIIIFIFTGCTMDAPQLLTSITITHRLHVGCTLGYSPSSSSLIRCTLDAP